MRDGQIGVCMSMWCCGSGARESVEERGRDEEEGHGASC